MNNLVNEINKELNKYNDDIFKSSINKLILKKVNKKMIGGSRKQKDIYRYINDNMDKLNEINNKNILFEKNINNIKQDTNNNYIELKNNIKDLENNIKVLYSNKKMNSKELDMNWDNFIKNYKKFDNHILKKLNVLDEYDYKKLSGYVNNELELNKQKLKNFLLVNDNLPELVISTEITKKRCSSCIKIFGEELEKEYNDNLLKDINKRQTFINKLNLAMINLRNTFYLYYLQTNDIKYYDLINEIHKCYNAIINNNLSINSNICSRDYLQTIKGEETELIDPYN